MSRKFISLLAMLSMAVGASAQPLTVEADQLSGQPLMKRYGTTIPTACGLDFLKNHKQDLADLKLPFIRVFSGFGEEKAGRLYENVQVDANGNIDFTTADEIADILAATGSIPLYSVTAPQGFPYHRFKVTGKDDKGQDILEPDFNNPQASDQPPYYNLLKKFSAHIAPKFSVAPIWELIHIPQDDMNPYWQQNKSYMSIFGAASHGVQEGCASQAVPAATYATNTYWLPNHDFWLYALLGCAGDQKGRVDGLTCSYEGYSSLLEGYKDTEGLRYEWWTYYLDSYIPEYTARGFKSANSYDKTAVVDFLNVVKETQKYSDVTKIGIGQFCEGRGDNTKGLLDRNGVKSPLYWALYLFNRMPVNSVKTTGGSSGLGNIVTVDDKRVGIILWNTSTGDKKQRISISNLPFSAGKITKYTIGAKDAEDGELPTEVIGELEGNSLSETIDVNNGETVFVFIDNADTTEPDLIPLKGFVHKQARWFFGRCWHPETWCQWDRESSTGWVGSAQEAAVIAIGADYQNVPDQVVVKGTLTGQKIGKVDNNSALYIRVDFGVGSGFNESYTGAVVFYDKENGQYSSNHESMPDGFNYGGDREKKSVAVNFIQEGGFVLDLKKNAPSNWNHNVRFMIYEQNPKTPSGNMARFQFLQKNDSDPTGINHNKKVDENVKTRIYDLSGKYVGDDESSLTKGIYVVKTGDKAKKILK